MDIEKRAKTRARRQKIQNIVLGSLYTTVAVGAAVVAPNSLQLLRHVAKHFGPKERLGRRMYQAIVRLQARGFIVRVQTEKGPSLKLTEKGKHFAELLEMQERVHVGNPKKWDGKWRIVIFDVWERRRSVRDQLRHMLKNVGFVKIQNSVWAYPYDCESLFAFLRVDLRLGKGMLYIVAEEVEYDEKLRKHFNLPPQ